VVACWRGRPRPGSVGGPVSRRCSRSSGCTTTRARAGARPQRGPRAASRGALDRVAHVPRERVQRVGDEEVAALVYPELAPLAEARLMIGHGVACYGAADRLPGHARATLGLRDRAGGHFERALELNRRMGANTWLARNELRVRPDASSRRATAPREPLLGRSRRARREVRADLAAGTRPGPSPPDGRRAAGRPLGPRGGRAAARRARVVQPRDRRRPLHQRPHGGEHIRSILRKTGCGNRTEATAYAYRRGLAQS